MTKDQGQERQDVNLGFGCDSGNCPLGRRDLLIGLSSAAIGATGTAIYRGREVRKKANTNQQLAGVFSGNQWSRNSLTYRLPSVDYSGNGTIITVEVEKTVGSGSLFVDLSDSEPNHDTQLAIREALETASDATGVNHDEIDLYVSFERKEDEVLRLTGKSWEAGLVISFAAILTGRGVSGDTLTTGIVDSDGSLIPVGSVEEKAQVARMDGANRLIVPKSQAVEVPGISVESATTIYSVMETVIGLSMVSTVS